MFRNFPLFSPFGCLLTTFQTFEGVKKLGLLAEFSPNSKSTCFAPLEEDGLQLPCAEVTIWRIPLASQVDVLHITTTYFRAINSPKEIRRALCRVCPLVSRGPELQWYKALKGSDVQKIKSHLSRENINYSNSLPACSSLPTSEFLVLRPFFLNGPLCLNLRTSLCS